MKFFNADNIIICCFIIYLVVCTISCNQFYDNIEYDDEYVDFESDDNDENIESDYNNQLISQQEDLRNIFIDGKIEENEKNFETTETQISTTSTEYSTTELQLITTLSLLEKDESTTEKQIKNSFTLSCEYTINAISYYFDVYRCTVSSDTVFGDFKQDIEQITGNHKNYMTNADVKAIFFDTSSVQYFPDNIHEFFPNIKGFYAYKSAVKELKQSNIKNLLKLEDIQIHHCKLTTIDENLFEFNKAITTIWLNDNEIIHIDPYTFSNLPKLYKLKLSENKCKENFGYVEGEYEIKKLVKRIENGACSSKIYEISSTTEAQKSSSNENDKKDDFVETTKKQVDNDDFKESSEEIYEEFTTQSSYEEMFSSFSIKLKIPLFTIFFFISNFLILR